MTLNEWSTTEFLQAGTRRGQSLARTLSTSTGVHDKGVANPQRVPAMRAWRDHDGLTVNCYDHGWGFTHSTPADEGFDAFTSDGCHAHGHGLRGGEPVGVVIAGGKVAHIVDVTEQEGHGAELP